MSSGIKAQQMEEENHLIFAKRGVECLVRSSFSEEILNMIKNPVIKLRCIFGEVLKLGPVCEGVDSARNSTMLEHGKDIRASPTPCVPATVEDTIKIDWVHLPSCRNS